MIARHSPARPSSSRGEGGYNRYGCGGGGGYYSGYQRGGVGGSSPSRSKAMMKSGSGSGGKSRIVGDSPFRLTTWRVFTCRIFFLRVISRELPHLSNPPASIITNLLEIQREIID
jgi:hypothetical protein